MGKDIALVRLFIWLPRFENFEVSYVCLIRKRIIMAKAAVPYRINFLRYCIGKTIQPAPALWKFWSFLCLSYKKKNNYG